MKHLSRFRRHRAVAPLLLVLAVFSIGTTFSVAGAATSTPLTAAERSALIDEGQRIFLKGCSSCHGLNLEGSAIAPALIGVGAASVDFQVATGRMPVADMSQQIARKDPVYNEKDAIDINALLQLRLLENFEAKVSRTKKKVQADLENAVQILDLPFSNVLDDLARDAASPRSFASSPDLRIVPARILEVTSDLFKRTKSSGVAPIKLATIKTQVEG